MSRSKGEHWSAEWAVQVGRFLKYAFTLEKDSLAGRFNMAVMILATLVMVISMVTERDLLVIWNSEGFSLEAEGLGSTIFIFPPLFIVMLAGCMTIIVLTEKWRAAWGLDDEVEA